MSFIKNYRYKKKIYLSFKILLFLTLLTFHLSSQNVSTFAGNGTAGNANGTGTLSSFNDPVSICTDPSGNIFVADGANNLIRFANRLRRAFEASCGYTDKRLFKDTCLLVSRKKMSAKRPLKLRANDDQVRPLTFICC